MAIASSSSFARIDLHTHILPRHLSENARQYLELRSRSDGDPRLDMFKDGKFFRTIEPNCFDVDVRLREMDEHQITMQVLSTIPVLFNYASNEWNNVLQLARELNDHIASICRQHPTRFVGLGTIPLQAPDLAIEELRRCVLELNLKGVQIGTHVNDWSLDHDELERFWAEAEKLDACVFVHPWDMPMEKPYDRYWLPWLCGMPFETTAAMCSFLMGGVLQRYPKLRIAFAHGGGSFPFTIGRIDHGHECRPDICAVRNFQRPSSYIGQFYVDSLVHDVRALKYMTEILGEDSIVLGSDYPFPLGEEKAGDLIVQTFENEPKRCEKMLNLNAKRFLKL